MSLRTSRFTSGWHRLYLRCRTKGKARLWLRARLLTYRQLLKSLLMMPASGNSLRKSKSSSMKLSSLRRKNKKRRDLKMKARSRLRKSCYRGSKLNRNYPHWARHCLRKSQNLRKQLSRFVRRQVYQLGSRLEFQVACRAVFRVGSQAGSLRT